MERMFSGRMGVNGRKHIFREGYMLLLRRERDTIRRKCGSFSPNGEHAKILKSIHPYVQAPTLR